MIFVTVGTTQFNALIQEVDKLAERGFFPEPVICQIGNGSYTPKHCEYFRFRPSLEDLLQEASVVISHGGTTAMALAAQQKRCVIIVNNILADNHQLEFTRLVAKDSGIPWSENPADLASLFQKALTMEISFSKKPSLVHDLLDYINSL